MDAGQKTSVRRAAVDAMEQLYKETVSEEASLAKEFEKKGIKFVTPDREAFRAAMTKQLTEDGLTAKWKPGLAEAIAAVK
jgi:TRAP-type C4-dicarboxylate transport system substrate-binding protein